MKTPRDISGEQLIKKLEAFGYYVSRQTGSHIRVTRDGPPQHHVTIPNHDPLRLGTLNGILNDVAANLKMPRQILVQQLFS